MFYNFYKVYFGLSRLKLVLCVSLKQLLNLNKILQFLMLCLVFLASKEKTI